MLNWWVPALHRLELLSVANSPQYQDFRRQEREYAKERQKNKKEADACMFQVLVLF
jgi:hypothetical protein